MCPCYESMCLFKTASSHGPCTLRVACIWPKIPLQLMLTHLLCLGGPRGPDRDGRPSDGETQQMLQDLKDRGIVLEQFGSWEGAVLGLMVVDGVSDGCACSVLISLSGSDMLNHEAAGCRSGFWCSFFRCRTKTSSRTWYR